MLVPCRIAAVVAALIALATVIIRGSAIFRAVAPTRTPRDGVRVNIPHISDTGAEMMGCYAKLSALLPAYARVNRGLAICKRPPIIVATAGVVIY